MVSPSLSPMTTQKQLPREVSNWPTSFVSSVRSIGHNTATP